MNTKKLIRSLKSLRAESERLWDMACDTCIDSQGEVLEEKQEECESQRESALEAWDDAIAAVDDGDLEAAKENLESARSLAAEWGYAGLEREAIKILESLPRPRPRVKLCETPAMHVPPENQGQIVTVSYGYDSTYLWRRTYDASDRSECWERAEILDWGPHEDCDVWNTRPHESVGLGPWEDVVVRD